MKAQFNLNRPVQYRCLTEWGGHSILSDGWREVGSDPVIMQYHMNYGFDETSWNAWYTVDELPGSSTNSEFIVPRRSRTAISISTRSAAR